MDTLDILRTLAIILISSKLFGLLARDLKAPQVAGEIIAGLLIGPSLLNLVSQNDFLAGMAEIGVILLMFSAGLETDIEKLKKSGLKAAIIAIAGVSVPLVLGTLLYMGFFGFSAPGTGSFIQAVFIGTAKPDRLTHALQLRFIFRDQSARLEQSCKSAQGRILL